MGNERVHQLRVLNKIADFFTFIAAFAFGLMTRWLYHVLDVFPYKELSSENLPVIFVVFCAANYFFLRLHKIYPTSRLRSFWEMAALYFKGIYSALIAIIVCIFIFQVKDMSRLVLISASTSGFFFLLIKEYLIRKLIVHWRGQGQNVRPVVIVGEDREVIQKIHTEIKNNHILGITVRGVFTINEVADEILGGYPNMGRIDKLIPFIEENAIENVIFLMHNTHSAEVEDLLFRLEKRGVEIWLKLGLLEREISRVQVDHLHDVPFLTFKVGPQDYSALMFKDVIDRSVAFLMIAALLPLFIVIPILIRLTSKGPAIFKQYRLGKLGKPFVFYKFRSMVIDAEELRDKLADQNEMEGPVFKIKEDPRITPIGKFLRRTSLDEIPQLWNVLKGDMSLVGPWPPIGDEVREYHGWQRRRLSMKPGITCIWQVTGRNQVVGFEDWVKMDLDYIDHWSLLLDWKILFKTIPAVFFAKGAR